MTQSDESAIDNLILELLKRINETIDETEDSARKAPTEYDDLLDAIAAKPSVAVPYLLFYWFRAYDNLDTNRIRRQQRLLWNALERCLEKDKTYLQPKLLELRRVVRQTLG